MTDVMTEIAAAKAEVEELTEEEKIRRQREWWDKMQAKHAYVESIWNMDWDELKELVFAYLDTQPERYLVGLFSGGGDSGGLDEILYTDVDCSDEDLSISDLQWTLHLPFREDSPHNPGWREQMVEKYGNSRHFEIKPYDYDLDNPENPLHYVSIATSMPQAKTHGTWADDGTYSCEGAVIWDKQERTCRLIETETFREYASNDVEW